MKTANIFEYATKNKLRFEYKGSISTEDLWTLSVTELDKIYKILNKKKKVEAEEESLLSTKTKEDEELEVQIAIPTIQKINLYLPKKKITLKNLIE